MATAGHPSDLQSGTGPHDTVRRTAKLCYTGVGMGGIYTAAWQRLNSATPLARHHCDCKLHSGFAIQTSAVFGIKQHCWLQGVALQILKKKIWLWWIIYTSIKCRGRGRGRFPPSSRPPADLWLLWHPWMIPINGDVLGGRSNYFSGATAPVISRVSSPGLYFL